jgi:hypothetical protein
MVHLDGHPAKGVDFGENVRDACSDLGVARLWRRGLDGRRRVNRRLRRLRQRGRDCQGKAQKQQAGAEPARQRGGNVGQVCF